MTNMFHNTSEQIHTRLTILNQNIHKTKTISGRQKMYGSTFGYTQCTIEDGQMPFSKGADGKEGYRWNG
jgi:hypothetical protein